MKTARQLGLEINADEAEPNQKWHFIENYLKASIADWFNGFRVGYS